MRLSKRWIFSNIVLMIVVAAVLTFFFNSSVRKAISNKLHFKKHAQEHKQTIKTYRDYESESRKLSQTTLSKGPSSITTSKLHFRNGPMDFNFAVMSKPTKEEIKHFIKKFKVVRPVPYPYYSVLSVPSDACGSYMSDIFYSSTIFSRIYGVDFSNSFFPVTDYIESTPLAPERNPFFISSIGVRPYSHPVFINGKVHDNLPVFLIYFYRGWLDHIHGWSTEGGPVVSLFEKTTLASSRKGESKDIILTKTLDVASEGFSLGYLASKQVKGFKISLLDNWGYPHVLAVGIPLGKKEQGWQFGLNKDNRPHAIYFPIKREKNRQTAQLFGEKTYKSGQFFKKATLTVYGGHHGQVTLLSLYPVPFSRHTVKKQLHLLRSFNILPIASTYHGGNTSWYNDIYSDKKFKDPILVDYGGKKYRKQRITFGAEPDSPTYISDLLNQFGLVYRSTNIFYFSKKNNGMFFKTYTTSKIDHPSNFSHGEVPRYVHYKLTVMNPLYQLLTTHPAHGENLGQVVASYLALNNKFGTNRVIYTHFNYFNTEALIEKFWPPSKSEPQALLKLPFNLRLLLQFYQRTPLPAVLHPMTTKSLPPQTEKMLSVLSDLKFNRSGVVPENARVWVPTLSANLRYGTVLTHLQDHTSLNGNSIHIRSWTDPVTGKTTPDDRNVTLDLHGQTFYVPKSKTANLYLNGHRIHALKRNPRDFTGRESVTVIDTTHPKLFFNRLNPFEHHYARVQSKGASLLYYQSHPHTQNYVLEIKSERKGTVSSIIKPFIFDNYETDYFRFVVKKSRPDLKYAIGWMNEKGETFSAFNRADSNAHKSTPYSLGDHESVWAVNDYLDTRYHDILVDYSDAQYANSKVMPRGKVRAVVVRLLDSKPGDSLTIDRIEFLGAPGIKAQEDGFVIGGKIMSGEDYVPVSLRYGDKVLTTSSRRGGWYFFQHVPKGVIAEITAHYRGVDFTPARGRLIEVHRNDVELNINTNDLRANSIPRPSLAGMMVLNNMKTEGINSDDALNRYDAYHMPHSQWSYYGSNTGLPLQYIAQDYANNYGHLDRDRQVENPDRAFRIMILGFCLEEGSQTPQFLHTNLLLESMLKQKLGRNVEVLVAATSSSSLSSRWDSFKKYGARFKPDLTLLMNNPGNMLTMEPSIQEHYLGFSKDHPAYKLFDFDDKGHLKEIERDPMYGKYVKSANNPYFGSVPMSQLFVTPEVRVGQGEKAYELLRELIRQKYAPLARTWGGKLALVYGYYPWDYPNTGVQGTNYVNSEVFSESMNDICADLAIPCINLSSGVFTPAYKEISKWERDMHLTPTGHYRLAKALMREILRLMKKNG